MTLVRDDTTQEYSPTKEELKELLAELYCDTPKLFRTIFSNMFHTPFSKLHLDIIKVLDSDKRRKLALAPRGLGKTTLCRAKVIRDIIYGKKKFVVYVSNSFALAKMSTEQIKGELITNKFIRHAFGDVKKVRQSTAGEILGVDDQFSKEAWIAFGETLVLPRGMGQQIRGLNWNNHRPDLVIFDDLEDAKELRNIENRRRNLLWFMGDAAQCVDRYRGDWELLYIDTLKHYDALPIKLMESKEWDHIRLRICDDNYKSYCEQLISSEEIQAMRNEAIATGTLNTFYREYLNIPIAPETASFKEDYFKRYKEDELTKEQLQRFYNVIIIDPARTVEPQSDPSAIIGVSFDTDYQARYIRDIINERIYPDQMYQAALDMCQRLNARTIAIEVTGLHEFIIGPFKDFLSRNNAQHIELVELKDRGRKKEDRISALIQAYRSGLIYHNEHCCGVLEGQLMDFPAAQYDDVADAVAYSEEFAEMGELYNSPMEMVKGRRVPSMNTFDPRLEEEYDSLYNERSLHVPWLMPGLTG
jgi:hypothetical protein